MKRFESDVVLRDGSLVHVRQVQEGDAPLLIDFLKGLSSDTICYRFVCPVSELETVVPMMLSGVDQFALAALRGDRIVGHASYYVIGSGRAEVAVVVADAYQRMGLGTILLGQLAEAANEAGISVFEAIISPENQMMIGVFEKSGFPTKLRNEPGLIIVELPTSLSPATVLHFEQREAVSAIAAMKGFFSPESIAVIGASRQRGTIGGELFHNLIEAEFKGPVYPVNPSANVVQSVVAYPSVQECPGPVDTAFIVVKSPNVVDVAKACARKGVRSLVVISAGFSETGDKGAGLQRELLDVCRGAGMRLIGPNCMGIVNTDGGISLNGQFSPFRPLPGHVGFLSQSGALGIAVIEYANRLGIGMSTFVSVGNKADISGNDLLQYWEEDAETDLILLYLESFGNPRKFSRIARRVAKKKPVVAVKSGRSTAGFRASQSHTGALVAASDITVDALFRQSGVIRTDTLGEMFDVALLLETQPVPRGNRVAVITNAGGAGILAADACGDCGLAVLELSEEVQSALKQALPPAAGVKNPVDMTAAATADNYGEAIRIVCNDQGIDALIVIFVPPIAISPEDVARKIIESSCDIKGRFPVVANFMASHGISELLSGTDVRIPSYPFPEAAVGALAKVINYGIWLKEPEGKLPFFEDIRRAEAASVVARALMGGGRWLTPAETQSLLGCYGIPLVTTLRVKTPEEAALAAEGLKGKVALKAEAPGLLHKTEFGAVKLGLEGKDAVLRAALEMAEGISKSGLELSAFHIQPMVAAGVEMLVGITNDSIFGPVIACGAGGVMVDLLKDVSVRITPLAEKVAGEMLRSLKTFPLLTGYRGGPAHDVAALEELILRVSVLAEDQPEVAELDLNPVIVLQKGVQVVDARVRIAMPSPPLPISAKKR